MFGSWMCHGTCLLNSLYSSFDHSASEPCCLSLSESHYWIVFNLRTFQLWKLNEHWTSITVIAYFMFLTTFHWFRVWVFDSFIYSMNAIKKIFIPHLFSIEKLWPLFKAFYWNNFNHRFHPRKPQCLTYIHN